MTTACRKLTTVGNYFYLLLLIAFALGCFVWFASGLPHPGKLSTVLASWIITVSGALIFLCQITRLKTKLPVPVTWNGIGFGLACLGSSIIASDVLIQTYLNLQLSALGPVGMIPVIAGLIIVTREFWLAY